MGKRSTKWDLHTRVRFENEGRGTGDGEWYKPQITTHDFPSKGKVSRIMGHTTHRIHHLMSQLEKMYFLTLDYRSTVLDIKEQYPLPLDITLLIAARLGIRHPGQNGYPVPITTDFYYLEFGEWHAVQVKTEKDLQKKRVQEKFAIEKAYYDQIGVEWQVVTDKMIPRELAENHLWLNAGCDITELIPDEDRLQRLCEAFVELYHSPLPFNIIIRSLDEKCALPKGTALQLFKHLVLTNVIEIDLNREINTVDPRRPL